MRNCFRCGSEFEPIRDERICCPVPQKGRRPFNPRPTFRERQVIELVIKAKLNTEIAYELHLTEGTIKEYLNRIFRKLGVSNRTELAVWWLTKDAVKPHKVITINPEGVAKVS